MAFSKYFYANIGIWKRTSPPVQACLVIRFLGGRVRAQKKSTCHLDGDDPSQTSNAIIARMVERRKQWNKDFGLRIRDL
jgi:hypothetical protein